MHDLARMLAAAAGPAEPGDLAGEDAARAAFTGSVPGRCLPCCPAVGPAPADRATSTRQTPPSGRAGSGSSGAGQHHRRIRGCAAQPDTAHRARNIGAPAPPRDVRPRSLTITSSPMPTHHGPSPTGQGSRHSAGSSGRVSDKTHPGPWPTRVSKGYGAAPGLASCLPAPGQDHGGGGPDPRTPPGRARLRTSSRPGRRGALRLRLGTEPALAGISYFPAGPCRRCRRRRSA